MRVTGSRLNVVTASHYDDFIDHESVIDKFLSWVLSTAFHSPTDAIIV